MKKLILSLTFALGMMALGATTAQAEEPNQPGCVNYLEVHPTSWNTGIIYYFQQCWIDDSWDTPRLVRMVPYAL